MIHIRNWPKKYYATYLCLVPNFGERPGCEKWATLLDVIIAGLRFIIGLANYCSHLEMQV